MDSKCLNKGIKYLGQNLFFQYWEEFTNLNNYEIISVGSGNGTVEKHLENKYNQFITCVDPDPHSFQKSTTMPMPMPMHTPMPMLMHTPMPMHMPVHMPDYPTCEQLISNNKNAVNNCNLFLNWPTPNDKYRYDMNAVKDLKPKAIFAVLETSGSAGSDIFLQWLNKHVSNMDDFRHNDFEWNSYGNIWSILDEMPKYQILESSVVEHNAPMGPFLYRYIILVQDLSNEYEPKMDKFIGTIDKPDGQDCSIM